MVKLQLGGRWWRAFSLALVLVHIVNSDMDEDIVDMPMKQVDDDAQEG